MKLEVGKTYLTRGGQSVKIIGLNPRSVEFLPYRGEFLTTKVKATWDAEGKFLVEKGLHSDDLIEEQEDLKLDDYVEDDYLKDKIVEGYNPIFIDNELVVNFDVDDTIVMHNLEQGTNSIQIQDPYRLDKIHNVKTNEKHIEFLKNLHSRGYTVVVWSAGGPKWANAVVEVLQLKQYVHLVMCKPVKVVDDLMPNEFLTRIYLGTK